MDFKQIQELIKMVNKSNIGEVTVEQKDFRLTIKQKEEKITQLASAPLQSQPAYAAQPLQIAPSGRADTPVSGKEIVAKEEGENLLTIRSPMIGTFYRRPAPDKPIIVEVGDEISPGKVVCIIEAMKLFNEIEAEISGTIVEVLVDNATPVEFDQPLFLVDPS